LLGRERPSAFSHGFAIANEVLYVPSLAELIMGSRFRTHLWSLTTDNSGYAIHVVRKMVWDSLHHHMYCAFIFLRYPDVCPCNGGLISMPWGCVAVRQLLVKTSMKSMFFSCFI
jgi:hypothetical protein